MPPRLCSADEIDQALTTLPGWRRTGSWIRCSYRLSNFGAAVELTQRIATVADELDHHPEWTVRYREVDIVTTTHDARGRTERDLELARRIVALAAEAGAAPIAAGVTDTKDPGGRDALLLSAHGDSVLVSPIGAQVLSWRHRGVDLLWTASHPEYVDRKPVRGGIPLVFPWFGDHESRSDLAAHGFARNRRWRLVERTAEPAVVLELTDDEDSRAAWPHAFALRCEIALGTALRVALTVVNTGDTPFTFEVALHSYFAVGDIHTTAVCGLQGVACVEHAIAPEGTWDPNAPLRFRAETDRVFQGAPPRIEIDTPALDHKLVLETNGADSAIVWNPWPAKTARLSQMAADDWQRFVCVESGNVHDGAIELPAGGSHTLRFELRCEPLTGS